MITLTKRQLLWCKWIEKNDIASLCDAINACKNNPHLWKQMNEDCKNKLLKRAKFKQHLENMPEVISPDEIKIFLSDPENYWR